jgi:NitT/TauT family transport system ATP-binding protein
MTIATQPDAGAQTGTGIQISGVSKSFGLRGGKSLLALQDTDLHTEKGSFLALLGPSGCGKSTILRILAALEHPSSGTALVDGESPDQLRAASELGIAFQDHALLPWRSVLTNIRLVFEIAGRRPDKAYIDELIQLVGLTGFEKAKPAQLSGGMRQRVSIARAFAVEPEILLCDEPFSSLDEMTARDLRSEFLRLVKQDGKTAVFITHHINEAIDVGDRVLVFHRPARIAYEARIDETARKTGRELIQAEIIKVLSLEAPVATP